MNIQIALKEALYFIQQGKLKEAEEIYLSLIGSGIEKYIVYGNLSAIYLTNGKWEDSINFANKALELKSDYPQAIINKAHALLASFQIELSIQTYKKAVKLDSNNLRIYRGIAQAYSQNNDYLKCIEYLKKALNINKKNYLIHYDLGLAYKALNHFEDSITYFQEALRLKPTHSQSKAALIHTQAELCDWTNLSKSLSFLDLSVCHNDPIDPWSLFAITDDPQGRLSRAQNYYKHKYKANNTIQLYRPKSIKSRKINIGYFSANFYNHPVLHLISNLIYYHNENDFNIFCYSLDSSITDEYTNIVQKEVYSYKDLSLYTTHQIVNIVRKDSIDIAIDLMGYTKNNRMEVFKERVAPIQISYLGYPGTTGSDCIDYLIADKTLIPPTLQKYYTEKILYLPLSYQCNHHTYPSYCIHSEKELYKLPEKSFVFACFNTSYKLTQRMFNIWMEIMNSVDGSVLWLSCQNSITQLNLKDAAIRSGIDPSRLIFAQKISLLEHIERHHLADIFLDTFPYNAGATASIALRGGLPIVTLTGESYTSRMSASLLNVLGLQDLITYSSKEYLEKVIELSHDKELLYDIKLKISDKVRSSKIFNAKFFVKDIESIYKELL